MPLPASKHKTTKHTQERELCLEESVSHEDRVEDAARVQMKKHKGETQTTKGFVFPQHQKKEKKTHSNVASEPTKLRKRGTQTF